jgi:hypothetical protein
MTPKALGATAEAPFPRLAGQSASRPRCSSRHQAGLAPHRLRAPRGTVARFRITPIPAAVDHVAVRRAKRVITHAPQPPRRVAGPGQQQPRERWCPGARCGQSRSCGPARGRGGTTNSGSRVSADACAAVGFYGAEHELDVVPRTGQGAVDRWPGTEARPMRADQPGRAGWRVSRAQVTASRTDQGETNRRSS